MKTISSLFFILLSSLLLIPSQTQSDSFTSVLVAQHGLDFIKDLLIDKAIASMIPLNIPRLEKSVKIPFLGGIDVVLSNITISEIGVSSSYVKPGETGVAIVASGAISKLSMDWCYSYSTWIVPVEVSDRGLASVRVEGMEIGLTLGLKTVEGRLRLSLLDCGCYVKDISITLDGGASWFYQGLINAFEEQIGSAVESTITKNLRSGISRLDSFLQNLPSSLPVDDNSAMNITFVDDPLLSNSSINFDINGLFMTREAAQFLNLYHASILSGVPCSNQSKMLGISVDEAVFNSASALYYNADFMQWVIDKIPDQSLLNTAGWRFIIPQLYRKYPNHNMNLNITLSTAPVMKISEQSIGATVDADLVIDVLEADQVIPVACISLVIHGSGSVKVIGNNLGGSVKVDDFAMSLKWSKIGNLHMYLIQPIVWTLVQTVFVPYANSHLGKGFPLPIIHGFAIRDAEIICSGSKITVCSDVAYFEPSDRGLAGADSTASFRTEFV